MYQRWDDSDSGIGIGIGIGTLSRWAESESELNRLLNFQLESSTDTLYRFLQHSSDMTYDYKHYLWHWLIKMVLQIFRS